MRPALQAIFQSWKYRLLFAGSTVLFWLLQIWLAHYALISFAFRTDVFSWKDKVNVLINTIIMFFTTFPRDVQALALLTAVLVGCNITFLAYYLRRQVRTLRAAGSSLAGVMISLVGVGCSACGSVVLSSLIGFGAATRVLTILPLRGKEFSLLAISILAVSTCWVIKKILTPAVCRVK